ncbi:hypothetical protein SOM61_08435 [Massilia sp. CFBP9012]|uniref:hypothetical protein n=1 Tax=Massilia sp. CFBP9012 TaxID=3096531 RepID=UPI002A69E1B9|nr:hypothetical protein [Massilia sp. CFBP9012]MDY0974987.1 hypothetical protein [Massilia sp. CFBP9012]
MPIARFEMPDGRIGRFEVPEGTTPEQAQQMIAAQVGQQQGATPAARAKPFGQDLGDALANVPRQVGLTARHAVEGVGEVFDSFVGNPLRTLANPILGNKPTARTGAAVADLVGLPQPRTSTERIVGDASRLVAGGAGMLGSAAKAVEATSGVPQAVARLLASNPGQQLASAGAAGLAGGYTRETGGDDGAQLVASLAAGVAAPAAIGGAQRAAAAVARHARPAAPTPEQAQQISITINNALQDSGIKLEELPHQVAQSIRNDVAAAFRTSDQVSPDAVRRLADYRMTGLTPTAAGLTLDPAVVTQQRNLAKLGVNSKDTTAQFLGQTENRNNQLLKQGLNSLGADAADDAYAGGGRVIDALANRDARAQQIIKGRYDQARAADGRSAMLDPYAFTQRANNLLDDALLGGKLPGDVRNLLNKAATGEMPLTVDVAEQFKTRIGELQRATIDKAEKKALGMVRSALDDTPLQAGQQIGQEALSAFNRARRLNRSYMQIVERTPALEAVRDGVEPDKFVQQFIVGAGSKSNFMDVAQLKSSIKGSPDAMAAVREQITGFLKQRALNGQADEVGNFSSAAYTKALDQIGDRKLRLFFQPAEINQMKALGRVSRYEQFQPSGAAVNNPNTAGALGGLAERILSQSVLSKIPFGQAAIGEPLQNIQVGFQSGRALDVPRTLARPRIQQPADQRGLLLSPAAFMGTETEEDRRRRLLTP